MRLGSTASVLAAAIVTSGLTATQHALADCTKDTDCKGDRVCESGRCVSSPAPSETTPNPPAATEPPAADTEPSPAPPVPPPPTSSSGPLAPGSPQPSEAPPDVGTAPLSVSAQGGPYVVSFEPAGKRIVGPCKARCTLSVPPGPGTLIVEGPQSYRREIVVPAEGAHVKIKTACVGCLVGGSVSLALGIASGITAVVYAKDTPDCSPYLGDDFSRCQSDSTKFTVYAVAFGVGGAALMGVGVPFFVRGLVRSHTGVEVEAGTLGFGVNERLRLEGAGVIPTPGGGMGALRFSF